jgi:transcriptional regulator GlxA family with amidase domain
MLHDTTTTPQLFELYVGHGFCDYEVSAVTHTLNIANEVLARTAFDWRFVAETPGVVQGLTSGLLRAEPLIDDHNVADVLIVVGGKSGAAAGWQRRARQMQRLGRPAVLLSDAATAYIELTKNPPGHVTTHWRDVVALNETGYYPNLTARFSENSGGIITAAGMGATAELIIGLISSSLEAAQVAELGNRLLLHTLRKSDAEQPKDIADNQGLFDAQVTEAIRLMEETIADPISMADLTDQLGLSTRSLERTFRKVFDDTPARFYKQLRTKRARNMIEETLLPIVDVAVATGFGSVDTMSKAVREEYGLSPAKMRARKKIKLLKYD